MQLELGARRGELQHRVVQLVEGGLRTQQAQAGADSRDMRIDRDVAQSEREEQHAGRGLASDARQRAEVGARLGDRGVLDPVEVQRVADRAQDRLDARGLHLRDAAGADRLLDLLERRVADRVPVCEALAQPQVRDVAVAVVRRLREDRQHELGDRVAVRWRDRHAVDLGEPRADARHPRPRRSPSRRRAPPGSTRGSLRLCPALDERPPRRAARRRCLRGARARPRQTGPPHCPRFAGAGRAPQRSHARAAASTASGIAAATAGA